MSISVAHAQLVRGCRGPVTIPGGVVAVIVVCGWRASLAFRRRRSWSRTWSQYIGRELGHRGGGGLGGAGGVPRRRLVCTGSRVVGRSGQDVLAGVVQRTLVFMGEAYRRLVVAKPVAVAVAEMKAAEGLYEG